MIIHNVMTFFSTAQKSDDPSKVIKRIRIEMNDGTILEAFRPIIATVEIDNTREIQYHPEQYFFGQKIGPGTQLLRQGLKMKVEFNLYQDAKGMFVWITRKMSFKERIVERLRKFKPTKPVVNDGG